MACFAISNYLFRIFLLIRVLWFFNCFRDSMMLLFEISSFIVSSCTWPNYEKSFKTVCWESIYGGEFLSVTEESKSKWKTFEAPPLQKSMFAQQQYLITVMLSSYRRHRRSEDYVNATTNRTFLAGPLTEEEEKKNETKRISRLNQSHDGGASGLSFKWARDVSIPPREGLTKSVVVDGYGEVSTSFLKVPVYIDFGQAAALSVHSTGTRRVVVVVVVAVAADVLLLECIVVHVPLHGQEILFAIASLSLNWISVGPVSLSPFWDSQNRRSFAACFTPRSIFSSKNGRKLN